MSQNIVLTFALLCAVLVYINHKQRPREQREKVTEPTEE